MNNERERDIQSYQNGNARYWDIVEINYVSNMTEITCSADSKIAPKGLYEERMRKW